MFLVMGNAWDYVDWLSPGAGEEGGDEKGLARLQLWLRLLSSSGPSQGFSFALRSCILPVLSLPGRPVGRYTQGAL